MNTNTVLFVFLACLFGHIVSPPVDPKKADPATGQGPQAPENPDLGLEYGRYLQQVIEVLEQDKEFAKKLENISEDAIKTGAVAHELEFVSHNVRTKLDELKRMEMDRFRTLVRMEQEDLGVFRNEDGRLSPPPGDGRQWRTLSMGDGPGRPRFRIPHHMDIRNPNTFEIEDLKKLIKTASKDLEDLNEKRKEEFKRYEMEKEHKYREELKNLNEVDRKAAEQKHQEMINKHKDHPQVHHPGSKQQLEQVWEEVDHLPKDEFDPKTFFRMHDINGDGYLDEEEVKALVALEVRKMYNISNEEDDPIEMQEEFARMEEHIFKEADKNQDHLISLNEFLDLTKKPDFDQDPGWKGLDEEQLFSPEELMEYERQLAAAQAGYHPNMPYPGGYPQGQYPPGQYQQAGYHPDQQYGYQPVHGAPPNNQGVQFQPLPQHQGQQQGAQHHPQQGQGFQQHPQQGQGFQQHPSDMQNMGQPHPGQQMGQQPHPGQGMGQPPHPGQPMGQPPHPGQPMGQPPHPGQPMGQPPHPGQPMGQPPRPGQPMGQPPHPGQPMGQAPHPGQAPVGGGAPPHYPPEYAPGAVPQQPPSQYGTHSNQPPVPGAPQGNQGAQPQPVPSSQVPSQPQVVPGSNTQQQQQPAQGTK